MAEGTPTLRIEGAEIGIQHGKLGRRMGWGSLALVALSVLLMFVFKPGTHVDSFSEHVRTMAVWGFLSSPLTALLALLVRGALWRRRGTIGVSGGELVIECGASVTRIPRGELQEGKVLPATGEVELHRRDGDVIRARLPEAIAAERLLSAAKLDASHRTLRVRLGEVWFLDFLSVIFGASFAVYVGLLISRGVPHGAPLGAAVAVVLSVGIIYAVRELLGPARLVVGADGIVVEQRFRKRFHSHERIASLEADEERMVIRMVDGAALPVKVRHLMADQRAALHARLVAAQRARQRGDAEHGALSTLDRGGRPVAAWREALGAMRAQADSYRSATLGRDDLLAVVESPAAPLERRLGAALALAPTSDDEGRSRIRAAARACADPLMRVALEKLADGDDDDAALEEALQAEQAMSS